MRAAAYCRVSTDKADQLNSLETQKEFFAEYTKREGLELAYLYADEGISGTKLKNRTEFLRMMQEARKGNFEIVLVKDVSRLARNTVDLLQSVRELKAMGIQTLFVTANMDTRMDSEFTLTIMAALAQEESANLSKRVKFGKKMNSEKGRVPNLVYGYDKTIGDYFNLSINEEERKVIQQIYDWYTEEGYGASKIANLLNERGLRTKRNCKWSQNAVCRILTNEIYAGRIVNGKESVADFLTSRREKKDESEWIIVEKPELRIISQEQYEKAQRILKGRYDAFHLHGQRQSNKFQFSTLIKCRECGWSFRRISRTYKNTYHRWACSGRNGNGASSCANAVSIEEGRLIEELDNYFHEVLRSRKNLTEHLVKEFTKQYKEKNENEDQEKALRQKLDKLKRSRQKYMDMYTDDLISREELNEKLGDMKAEMERLETELRLAEQNISRSEQLEEIIRKTFQNIEDIVSVREMTNEQLKQIIDRIEVDKDGTVDITLKVFGELGLEETVLLCDDQT